MDKEKATELVNEFERIKETIMKLDEEIIKYQNATLSFQESSKTLNDLSNTIKTTINVSEEIKNELLNISSEEVMTKFNEQVERIIYRLHDFEISMKSIDKNIDIALKNFEEIKSHYKVINVHIELIKQSFNKKYKFLVFSFIILFIISIVMLICVFRIFDFMSSL